MTKKSVRIGGACGYWGESPIATPQFLTSDTQSASVDYIVYDYLAEITMSILARAKAKKPDSGYATDFITSVLKPNLLDISKSGVKLVSNAGGVNPDACGEAARALIKELGLDLKVAVITGDNILDRAENISKSNPKEMFTGEGFPDPDKIASINTYIGAFPIAKALDEGADIVITGRCVDSAVTLGICIHELGWQPHDFNALASGSLAGHILECGPQATGGNFTDWELAGNIANIGYPIAKIHADGSFEISKPENTSGLVSVGTISEQMLYEIANPQSYMLPDVICDFSEVSITQKSKDIVHVSPAKGLPAPDSYKTCVTFSDGYRTGMTLTHYGFDAAQKARKFANAALERASATLQQLNMQNFTETSIEIIGDDSQYGDFYNDGTPREVVTKIAAKHPTMFEGGILLKEIAGLGLASAPGLSGFQGARPKPSPLVRLFSYLTPKQDITLKIECDGITQEWRDSPGTPFIKNPVKRHAPPAMPAMDETKQLPLIELAWGRSGDKGNKANIGIIARHPDYLPFIWNEIDEEVIAQRFAHFIEGANKQEILGKIERYYLPGSNAINYVIDDILGGGGVASIRNDPQGKGYAQILLAHPVCVPANFSTKS